MLGVALLGAGIYVLTAPETNLDNLDVDNFLTAPAILLCIIGGLLFILGFCGCLGALLELYIPLLVVCWLNTASHTEYLLCVYFHPVHWCPDVSGVSRDCSGGVCLPAAR